MFASSLFILFSSSSLALAFRRSAMNWTRPRMFELVLLTDRPRKPAAPAATAEAMLCVVGATAIVGPSQLAEGF